MFLSNTFVRSAARFWLALLIVREARWSNVFAILLALPFLSRRGRAEFSKMRREQLVGTIDQLRVERLLPRSRLVSAGQQHGLFARYRRQTRCEARTRS